MDPRSQFQFIANSDNCMLSMSGNRVYLALNLKEEVTGLRLEKSLFTCEMKVKEYGVWQYLGIYHICLCCSLTAYIQPEPESSS